MRRRSRAFVLLLLCGLAIGCGSDEARLTEHLERAEAYRDAGRPAEALIELRNALKLGPNDAATHFRLARLMEEEGRLADAVFYYRETTRLDPEHTEAALAEAFLLYGDDADRAEELVEGVLAREPENLMAHIRRSDLALVRVNTQDALAAALTAVELDPKNVLARLQVALVHKARISEKLQLGEEVDSSLFAQAIESFDQGITLAGDDEAAAMRGWLERAEVYAAWPDHEEQAAEAFRAAVEAAPSDSSQILALGATDLYARRSGDVALRRWTVQRLIEMEPDNVQQWGQMAWLIEQEGGDPESFWQERLAERPDDAEAAVLYARDLARRNRHPDAIAFLHRRLEEVDSPAVVGTFLSRLLISRGRVADARAVILKLDAIDPGSPDHDLAKASLALAEGRTDAALALARASANREDSVAAQTVVAEAELRLGHIDAALAASERALDLSDSRPDPALLRLRARIALRVRDWTAAIRFFRQAFWGSGRSWTANDRVGLAQAFYGIGRSEEAVETLGPVLQRESPYPPAVFLFASHERNRDPESVRRMLEKLLAGSSQNTRALVELTRLEFEQGRPEEGLRRIKEGLAANPGSAPLYALRARLMVQKGDAAAAEADARRALELAPDMSEATDLLARILVSSGRAGQAVAELQKGAAQGSIPTRSRLLLARLLSDLGQPVQAAELYEAMLAEGSGSAALRNDYALLLVEQGRNIDRALELAREAQDLSPESPATADTLGMAYLAKGLPDAARNQIEFALELLERRDQDHPSIRYHHGLVLKELGRPEEALDAFERALEAGDESEFPEADEARRQIEAIKAIDAAS